MKSIKVEDLEELNDIIVELPAFANLKSKEYIANVLDLFMKDIYLKQPKELLDAFDFKLSENMQTTFYRNYGIDNNYDENLTGYIKSNIAYELEKLFQHKGSIKIFELLATVLESVFNDINFYNVEVQKEKRTNTEGYIYKYMLRPLYIQNESVIIKEPEIAIEKSRKYLMDLSSYKEYTIWPVTTNYIYIQYSAGNDLVNNTNVFLNGIRSYGGTYLGGIYFNYLSSLEAIEKIEAIDLELLASFIQLNLLKAEMSPGDTAINTMNTNLSMFKAQEFVKKDSETEAEYQDRFLALQEEKKNHMGEVALLFNDYKKADYNNRSDMEDLRRRWQMFLRANEAASDCYSSMDEVNQTIEDRYPLFYEDFFDAINNPEQSKTKLYDLITKLYSIFLNGVNSSYTQPFNKECFTAETLERPVDKFIFKNEAGDILSQNSSFSYIPTTAGTEKITLTVENEDGFIDVDTLTITSTVNGPASPTVDIDKDVIYQVGSTVLIKGSAGTTPGNFISEYMWILDGEIVKDYLDEVPLYVGIETKKVNLTLELTEIKDYILELRVKDSMGGINSNKMTIRSIKGQTPDVLYPQAYAGPNLKAVVSQPIIITGDAKDLEILEVHDTDWINSYIDTVFRNLFLNKEFLNLYISPVMDLFEKYFFPVELEYKSDLINREKIKDKWNVVNASDASSVRVNTGHSSIQTPIRGTDIVKVHLQQKPHDPLPIKDYVNLFDETGKQVFPKNFPKAIVV